MIYINHLSIKINLEDMIKDVDYEKKVLENIRRCNRIVGERRFKVIFWHTGLNEKVCKDFVKRNEKILFEISTMITTKNIEAWFVIDTHKIDKGKYHYKYTGDILSGIVNYLKMIKARKRIENDYENSNSWK